MAGMRALPDSEVRDPDRSVDPCRRRWFPVLPAHGTDRTHPPDPVGGHRSSSWCRSQDGLSMPELMNRLGRNDKTDVPGHLAFFASAGEPWSSRTISIATWNYFSLSRLYSTPLSRWSSDNVPEGSDLREKTPFLTPVEVLSDNR